VPADKIVGDADQLQELGIVGIVLIGDGERFAGKRGLAARQIGAGETAQRLAIMLVARQGRVVGEDRLVELAHGEERIAGGDERRDRGGIDRGGSAECGYCRRKIAAGRRRRSDPHQCRIVERGADAMAV